MTKYYGFWYGAFPTLFLFAWNTNINCNVVHNKFFWQIFIVFQGNVFHILNPLFIWLKWCASSRWLSSLYGPLRNSGQTTYRKTHPTLIHLELRSFFIGKNCINSLESKMDQKKAFFPERLQWIKIWVWVCIWVRRKLYLVKYYLNCSPTRIL